MLASIVLLSSSEYSATIKGISELEPDGGITYNV